MFRSFRHAALVAVALLGVAPVALLGVAPVALLSVAPVAALAHTALVSSSPVDGSGYADPPRTLELEFSTDVHLTAVMVTDQTGAELETDFAVSTVAASAFAIALPPLGGGDYTVGWRALSEDGHPVEGSFTFSVVTRG